MGSSSIAKIHYEATYRILAIQETEVREKIKRKTEQNPLNTQNLSS